MLAATIGGGRRPPPPSSFGDDSFGDGDGDGDGRMPSPVVLLLAATWRAYTTALERQPLLAKSMTAGLVGGLGDLVAQWITRSPGTPVDVERFLAVAFDGLLVSGPGLHLGYS